jgi:excisionase family DNA binding protein
MAIEFTNKTKRDGNILRDIRWGAHVCLLYHTKQDLIDVLVPYFKAGLENNELCLWIISKPLTVHHADLALSEELEGLYGNIKEKEQMEIVEERGWYTRGGKLDYGAASEACLKKLYLALNKGFKGLRTSGGVAEFKRQEWQYIMQYESIADSLVKRQKMISICTYSLDRCKVTDIVNVISNHRFIVIKNDAKWELIDNTGYRWLNELRWNGATYSEIGRKLGVSRQRVREIVIGRTVSNKKVQSDQQMLAVSKAAELLNVHSNTLRNWGDNGLLPCYRMGLRGDRRFKRADLINFRSNSLSTT